MRERERERDLNSLFIQFIYTNLVSDFQYMYYRIHVSRILFILFTGAGDGEVTDKMARYYSQVYATEVSSTMVWRLQEKNYKYIFN